MRLSDEMVYCLTHEEWAHPGLMDYIPDECAFVTSMPPELDMSDEWVDSLPVPGEDELLIMDMNAEVLEADFIGA
jgi:hypothetical protein